MRHVFILGLVVLGACRPKTPEGRFTGEIPVVIVNATPDPICEVSLYARTTVRIVDDLRDPCLQPGERREFHLMSGNYEITCHGAHYSMIAPMSSITVGGPSEVVFWDNQPPPATAGMKQFPIESEKHRMALARAKADANAASARQACTSSLAPANEAPAPGKTKATGKWKCVLGGAFNGTDYVDLVQLADGHISATVSGADRNQTWTGAVVGDEVHFRWGEGGLEGGVLKLDSGGRAMSGKIYTLERVRCVAGTLTCTR